MARVFFARAARAQVSALDIRIAEAVLDSVTLLEADPEAGHRLRGKLEGLRSLRLGTYRLVYEIRERGRTVRVVAVLHRSVAYTSDPR